MPFTKQEDRKKVDDMSHEQIQQMLSKCVDDLDNIAVGDKCYYFYKQMVTTFNNERRWTVAHYTYETMKFVIENSHDLFGSGSGWADDTRTAYDLAWQVFFAIQVMPYELEKQALNGDINGDIKGDDLSVN